MYRSKKRKLSNSCPRPFPWVKCVLVRDNYRERDSGQLVARFRLWENHLHAIFENKKRMSWTFDFFSLCFEISISTLKKKRLIVYVCVCAFYQKMDRYTVEATFDFFSCSSKTKNTDKWHHLIEDLSYICFLFSVSKIINEDEYVLVL